MKFKKVLSAVAAASMAISAVGALNVSAAEMPGITADYVKGDMPENMFGRGAETASRMLTNHFDRNDACIQNDLIMDESQWSSDAKCFKFAHYYAVNDITGNKDVHADCGGPYYGFVGIWHDYGANFIDKTKNYVFSVNAKNISDIPCALDIALSNGGYGATSYSNEYKSNGKTISSDDYETFKATIKAHPDFNESGKNYLALILPVGTKAGAKLEFKFEKADDVYFGEEQAYDISVSADGDTVYTNNSLAVNASILNQIGLEGELKQNFKWYALNEDRTALADGINIVTADDTKTATVIPTSDAQSGKYTILAVSDDYSMAKGVTVNVKKEISYKDYTPGAKPENMFGRGAETASRMLTNHFDRNDACIQNDLIMDESQWSEDAKCFKFAHYYAVNDITGNKDVHADCGGPYYGFVGIWHNYGANFIDKTKNYVFSVNAKNISDIPCALDIALSNGGYGATSYSNEYKSNGKIISSDDYETFKATIKAHPNFDESAANYLALILPVGTKAGAKLEFKFEKADDVYFGEEQAYDIRVNKMSDSDILSQGQTAEFGAEVVNQIETVGNLSQNFTWKAMNKERTEFIDSITIAPSADTSTAAVTIGEQTPDGDYDIVAVSNDYEIAKGASITVGRKTPKITLLNASQFSGYVDLSARVENAEGMISFAIGYYSADGRLLGADLKNVNAENANAECSITSSKAYETGTLVKIYVWSGEMQPISNPDGFVSQLTIE